MTANELIQALQALPAELRQLPCVTYESSWLIAVERPKVKFRDADGFEADTGERVLVL